MARSAGGGGDEGAPAPGRLPQDPYVERLKPDPSQPARRMIELVGLPGNSDRPGYQRLYLTTKLDYYAEFLASDMVHSEAVAADRSPIPGHETTRVSVSRDATIHYIWARSPHPVDEFDLDIRLGARAAGPATPPLPISPPPCVIQTATCAGHATCPLTCGQTCQTCAGHATCAATCAGQATCQTCAADATCAGHGTCQGTCATICQQMTCITCQGATCPQTCVG
jgi:hypothetical protein